ncbi:glycerol-3-phosphate dehydrogenase [Xylella taiwanensis]|uniref:Glycerol-3-phosphate dehydrogenase n=1 Tax=Xylella taiwanensis TaxID=1444770 RepID=Z9JK18_9GAMM|nr:glycerol-3-phosphate dehydrogenase [Xylella taiwanensis]AXI83779.1 glycerol-3-phosphate dehydrogenase [Xylella taiwanensis]EWS78176.1 glycerol-3-phosphate dehydrogenase [Xylella taiwanensis]MCD8456884.1 glycerol-3-phosphate dehydrogenase [Xylella taiwanensis]MCD8459296.1 glycerol-3-phosphate dehydrogenase [Xylella taiwanensis]MCD8461833.1 glycerol-3-phosphate dehydrogenase [Xylella taiwanensis]
MTIHDFDLLVVGGGINGAGIARDAAGRHLSVCLCEQHDLASHTSSASTKLIHGGLRYLEHYEFALVSKALTEREVLLRQAPHIVRPLHFILPHQPHLRPTWMIRAGLLLYDYLGLGRRTLPGSRRLNLTKHPGGEPLKTELHTGFMYCDAQVQDARLVVLNAMDAARRGARILTRTRCMTMRRDGTHWLAELEDAQGTHHVVRTRAVVNATGPWAVAFLDNIAQQPHRHSLRLVKGSHIVVPRLFKHDHAYIFQQPDRRIVFAIPYEQDFTLIGTTDVDDQADPVHPHIDAAEMTYLCNAVNAYFRDQITPEDIVWSYSGVRPLLNDAHSNASKVTRDYQLEMLGNDAPLLNVFGGKLTTYRKLAEEAVNQLCRVLGHPYRAWTGHDSPLPGGECHDIQALERTLCQRRPWLPASTAQRLIRNYGTCAEMVLGDATNLHTLGIHFGADLYQAEVDYLRTYEWACSAEDILWRRSKLGLRLDADVTQRLEDYLSCSSRIPEEANTTTD